MDPNANLAEQRELAVRMEQIENADELAQAADRFAQLALALDEWIASGGFLPEAWRGGDFERIEPLDEGRTLNVKLTSEGIIADRVDAEGDVEATWALTYGELDERLY